MKNSPYTISKEQYANEQTFLIEGIPSRHRVEAICIGPDDTVLACSAKYNGYIELPGGGVDVGESIVQTALREIQEEAGWEVIDPQHVDRFGSFLYKAEPNSWLIENGYNQESNSFVSCKAIRSNPNHLFDSQSDAKRYELMNIDEVIYESMCTIRDNKDARGVFICRSRLEVLKYLFSKTKAGVPFYDLPKYHTW